MGRLLSYMAVFVLGFTACAVVINRLPPYQGTPAAAPARPRWRRTAPPAVISAAGALHGGGRGDAG